LAEGQEQVAADELFKQLKVADLLLGMFASVVQLGYAKLEDGETEQARLAIEALRALAPVLEGASPPEALRDLRQATANLQLAYASKLRDAPAPEPETQDTEGT
jgi:hypothetical protein